MKIILVAGARPNFMKIAPVLREIKKRDKQMTGILVHTGQHYDHTMSGAFFKSLHIDKPDYNLDVGSGTHAYQTAQIMVAFEEVCLKEKPDMVVVVGDVNSTIAAGLVAKKLHIPLAHIEAGLRSGDRAMPEEINRIATDAISDLFFTTEKEGTENLLREGHKKKSVHFVGHVMIDNLFYQLSQLHNEVGAVSTAQLKDRLSEHYMCMTLHRPSNVDSKEVLGNILEAIGELSLKAPIIFPCHPRTLKQIQSFNLISLFKTLPGSDGPLKSGCFLIDPLNYNDFLYLWKDAACVLTDSGGLQEETTALKIPCITIRENTERPITAEIGSNVVVGTDKGKIIMCGEKALAGEWKNSHIPDLWDGKASGRIVDSILKFHSNG